MKTEPMFIRYANRDMTEIDVVKSLIENTQDDRSKEIAEKALDNMPDLQLFKRDFINALEDIIDNGVNNQFINYINSYMKPSLEEFVESSGVSNTGETRWVRIKEPNTPWIEALLCYNLTLFIKVNGLLDLKKCPICKRFFSHKGKYAKYCSDVCKESGGRGK